MFCSTQTKRNLTVLLTAVAVLAGGLALTAWAKKPDNPGGGKPGGEDPARYTIVDFDSLIPDSGGSYSRSINESGQVAGFSYSPAARHAFLFTSESNSMIDIGTLDGDSESSAYDVNNSGQVVGWSYRETAEEARAHAFLWDSISGMVDLGTLGAFPNSSAHGISNSDGTSDSGPYVVGFASMYSSSLEGRAFIIVPEDSDGDGELEWFQDDGQGGNALMIDLGTLPGHDASRAWKVNDSGQVVGVSFGQGDDLRGRGFLITPEDDGEGNLAWFVDDGQGGNALMIELSPLSGHEGTAANAINSSGQVVGSSWSMSRGRSSDYHAVLWEADAQGNVTVTDLGKVKGKGATTATSINDAGQVVGCGSTAFLWENGKMTKLIDLIANSDGIGDLDAWGINEAGEIVGTIFGDGYHHAYIALPIASP